MRTIGKKNIELVKKITREETKKSDNFGTLSGRVMVRLPEKMWDTWESAHDEINRIIHDTMWERTS